MISKVPVQLGGENGKRDMLGAIRWPANLLSVAGERGEGWIESGLCMPDVGTGRVAAGQLSRKLGDQRVTEMAEEMFVEAYDRAYRHLGNRPPDWRAADANPRAFASKRCWLPSDKNARVVDIGCGWGHLLMELWCAGYRRLEGVDLSPGQAELCQKACGNRFPVACADGIQYLADKDRQYDLVLLFDVIEHIPAATAHLLLQRVNKALVPGGRVVIRTPNMSALLASHARYIDVTHVMGYTDMSIQQLLDSAGFVDHCFVPDDWGWCPSRWRPWAPLRGLGIPGLLNHVLTHLFYRVSGRQRPAVVARNIEIYSHRPSQ